MALSIGAVSAEFVADTQGFIKNVGKAEQSVSGFSKGIGNAVSGALDFGKKISLIASAGAVAFAGFSIKSSADLQNLSTSFETLTGSAEKGKKLFEDLKKLGATTPFETQDLARATQTMLSFGMTVEDSQKTLRMLGDVSLGNKEKLGSLSLAFAQVQSKGRLMGQEVLQMINQGFNPLTIISQQTGKSMIELQKEMEDGAISADMVTKAFESATSEGGLFYKGMDRGASTLSGTFSTLKDNITLMGAGLVGLAEDGTITEGSLLDLTQNGVNFLNERLEAIDWPNMSSKLTSFVVGVKGLITLIKTGDYTGPDSLFGLGEDSSFVDFIITARDGIIGIKKLIFEGDYTGPDSLFGFSEDSKLVDFILTVREKVIELTNYIKQHEQIILSLVKTIGILAGAFIVITGVVTVFTGVIAFLTSPIMLIIGGISLLAVGIEMLKQKWDKILPILQVVIATFVMFGAQVLSAFLYAWEQLRPAVESLWKEFQKLWEVISPIVGMIATVLIPGLVFVFQIAFAILVQVIKGFILALEGLIQFFRGFIQIVRGIFQGDFGMILEGVKAMFIGFAKMLISIFQMFFMGPLQGVVDGIKNVFTGIDFFKIGMDWMKSLTDGIKSKIGGAGKAIKDGLSGMIPEGLKGKIPGFANGVTNFGGGLAVVGERGPELVNLPKGSDVFTNAESKDMMRGMGGSNITNNFTVNNLAEAEYISRKLALQLRTS
jgi:tape measure domain-containing protein